MDTPEKEIFKKDYPSNSHTQKIAQQEEPETPKVTKVVTGKVRKQKKGLAKRFAETFLEDDTKSVGAYIINDVLIPAGKSMICDVFGWGGFVEMMLFGDRRSGRGSSTIRRDGGRTVVNYGSFSRGDSRDNRDRRREVSQVARARHDFDEIVFETRGEAENVLAHLVDLTIDYGMASISDFYEMCDVVPNFTDNKYGWTDLRGVTASRLRGGGYVLNLPRPQPLD